MASLLAKKEVLVMQKTQNEDKILAGAIGGGLIGGLIAGSGGAVLLGLAGAALGKITLKVR